MCQLYYTIMMYCNIKVLMVYSPNPRVFTWVHVPIPIPWLPNDGVQCISRVIVATLSCSQHWCRRAGIELLSLCKMMLYVYWYECFIDLKKNICFKTSYIAKCYFDSQQKTSDLESFPAMWSSPCFLCDMF